jgi:hypothetical protein
MATHLLSLNYKPISPWREMGAYEALWSDTKAWFKNIADRFAAHPGWRQPIVVDGQGVIICGHTRLLAAQKLGLREAPVHVAGPAAAIARYSSLPVPGIALADRYARS